MFLHYVKDVLHNVQMALVSALLKYFQTYDLIQKVGMSRKQNGNGYSNIILLFGYS